jgi:uncharacterized protein (DUF2336 family)
MAPWNAGQSFTGWFIGNLAPMLDGTLSPQHANPIENQSLIDELDSALAARDEKHRLRVLERITDLFTAGARGYSSEQIALFDDVLQELCAEIEVKARARLAHRLAHIKCSPPKLIRSLAFDDEIAVAEPVLVHSQQLSDADLVENAATKGQKHLFAIAQRLTLSELVTDVLVERGDRHVVHKVAINKSARFSPAGYGKLTFRAHDDDKLTLALGQRGDLPRQYFLKLLETASASVRAMLEAANPQAAAAIRDTVDDVATTMQHEVRKASDRYATATHDAKARFNGEPLSEADILATAHAQEFERTVVALAKLGGIPVDLVERALLDKGADMVLIIARAAGCSWTTVKELLRMYAAERDLRADSLAQAAERYNKLTEETARNIINFYGRRMKLRTQHNARHRKNTDSAAQADRP